MSNRPVMNKANRDRYLSKANRLCKLYFNGDITVEFDDNTLIWKFRGSRVSRWTQFPRQAAIVPRMIYEELIQLCRLAEANFRMIAVTDKFKQELGERVTTSHSTDGEDEMVAYSSRISEYDITLQLTQPKVSEKKIVVLLTGCFNKKQPKDHQLFIYADEPTDDETRPQFGMTPEYLEKICDLAAESYRKQFAEVVETYGPKFNQDIRPNVRADIADVGVAEGSDFPDTLSTKTGPVVVPEFIPDSSHTYYIKKQDGSEEILSGENLNDHPGEIVVDLTKLYGPGKEPNLEEFHKQWSDDNSYLSYAEGKPAAKILEVIETTEGTCIEPDYNNKFQDSTKDQLPETKEDA